MQNAKRVAVNTIAQYVRTIINMLLSLYTVRMILITLGSSDYGIYSVVAGVVSMLAFITNALVSTTQRYLSYYQGQHNVDKMKEVFSNSELIHLIIGGIIVALLLALTPLLFNGFLNIDFNRIEAAKRLYFIIVVMLFITFCTAPFRALLVAHENIVYISVIDIMDGLLRVIAVVLLSYVTSDKLVMYGVFLLGIQLINLLAFSLYSFRGYEECIFPKLNFFSKSYCKELASFTGWVVYGTGCYIVRDQGIAIVVNKFMSTIANAAYGIGRQVSNAVGTVSGAVLTAMRPQIVRAEGAGNHTKSIALVTVLCKISFFLLTALGIPCVFEIPRLLELWLKEVPEYTVLFARMALIAAIADSLTSGLSVLNEAIGNIKHYHLFLGTLKLLALPLSVFFMYLGLEPIYVAISYVGAEFLVAVLRLPFLKRTGGLIVSDFLKNVIAKEILPTIVSVATCYICVSVFDSEWRFLMTFSTSILLYGIVFLVIGLTVEERNTLFALVIKSKRNL